MTKPSVTRTDTPAGDASPSSPSSPRRGRFAAVSFAQATPANARAFDVRVEGHVRFAADCGAEIVVFPEYVGSSLLALGGGWPQWSGHLDALFSRLAKECGLAILGGTHPETSFAHGPKESEVTHNVARLFFPDGRVVRQRKLHATPFERKEWTQCGHDALTLVALPSAKAAILVCYDVEFPELARVAARAGAEVLLVPSWTDDVAGAHRVSLCTRARCVENSMFAVGAPLVGTLPGVRFFEQGRGQAGLYAPCDLGFPPNGVVARGTWNADECVVGEFDFGLLAQAKASGTVTPFHDSRSETSYRTEHA